MNTFALWANRHDSAKLLVIALILLPTMFLAGLVGESLLFLVLLLGGMVLCGIGAYWLGNRKWLFIPLLAMLVFIILAVPATIGDPSSGETPFSMIIESPFWAGLPALIGASVGIAVHTLVRASKRRRS